LTGRLPLLVALPPSEGKAPGGDGPPLDLATLSHADALSAARGRVVDALVKLCSAEGTRGVNRARKVLGLSEGLTGEIAVDAAVRTAPTLPAARRYTGVLYDHLSLATLPPGARRRAAERVVIVSGLWGALSPEDAIPAYRLPIGVTLPRLGKLTAFWRAPLARALPEPALVVDCRSSDYQQAWKPAPGSAVVLVRVFSLAPDGTRKVISHMAKATRGDVARALLLASDDAGTPVEVAAVVEAAGFACVLVPPAKAAGAWTLDVDASLSPSGH
jgi:cytoplasmic iron level regulating protein YaaA (DUF328/UPF0246 family)